MKKIKDRYWIVTDSTVHSSHPQKPNITSGIKGTSCLYVHATHTQNPHNPNLSRFEIFSNAQTFCGKPEPLYSTQNSDLFVTYIDGFKMHRDQLNPQSVFNEYNSGKNVLNTSNN